MYNPFMPNQNLTKNEISSIVKSLKKLEPGFMPKEIFYELSRLVVFVAVDIVVFRKRGNTIEVLLVKRPEDDPYWPGLYHITGCIVLSTDKAGPLEDAQKRVLEGELNGIRYKNDPKFVTFRFGKGERGTALTLLHWINASSEPKVGNWFDVNELPKDILRSQIPSIKLALEDYRLNN